MGSLNSYRFLVVGVLLLSVVLTYSNATRVKRQDEDTEANPEPTEEAEATEPVEANTVPTDGAEDGDVGGEPEVEAPDKPEAEPTADNTGTGQNVIEEDTRFKDVPKAELKTPREWIDKSIQEHNRLREMHNSPPLKFSQALSEIAQDWANEMARTGKFAHRYEGSPKKPPFGENLFYSSNSEKPVDVKPEDAILAWYEEIENYNFSSGYPLTGKGEILHFTQLIWLGTTEMGTAYAITDEPNSKGMYTTYVVANYFPSGNFDNFLKNVLPLDKKKKGQIPEILDDVEKNVKDGLNDLVSKGKNKLEDAIARSSSNPIAISVICLTTISILVRIFV